MTKEVIRVIDLSKEYNGTIAVRDVNFNVYENEIFSLLGPNGAGKTTLLNIIAGVIHPTKGKVFIKDYDMTKASLEARRRIGFLPQEVPAYDYLTGEENLLFYAGLYGIPCNEAKRRAKELLEIVGLGNVAKRKVKTYSGGMKRRLALAIALINDPEVIILDEPTTGLDPGIRRSIWEFIQSLKKKSKTILLSTHYMEEADVLSDRVAIMHQGKILVIDSPEALKKSLGPYSVIEIEVQPRIKVDLKSILEDLSEAGISQYDNTCKLLVKDPDPLVPIIAERLVKHGIRITRIHVSEPTLEDVFLKLTGRRLEEE